MKPYKDENGVWHFDDIPICSTGIEYPLGTGKHTFTQKELEDAVQAASGSDVAVNAPRLKLGHKSKANDLFLGEDEPAFGRVEGMHLSDNKQTIIGNYVGTPEWLAKVLPTAYPNRSVDAQLGVNTVTGKQYEMVITDVSLLGVRWPGCTVLEDLPLWYGDETPEDVEIAAALDVSSIRSKFYREGPGKENVAWWIRGERFDSEHGYNLIVDEGNGDICRIPVTVDDDAVEFGDAMQVTEEYPDKAVAAAAVIAGMKMADPAMVIYASRADSPDQPTREGMMDEATRTSLAAKLGLPEDATEGQINAKMAEQVLAEAPEEGDETETETETEEEEGGEAVPQGEPAPGTETETEEANASATVTLDRATFERIKAGSELATKHEKERQGNLIRDTVEAAVDDGRIPPARREHWRKALTADYEGSKAVLDKLEKGLVPLRERGASGGETEGVEAGAAIGLPESWFPEIAVIRQTAAAGRPVVQAKEG